MYYLYNKLSLAYNVKLNSREHLEICSYKRNIFFWGCSDFSLWLA